ncbi:MAG TPA: C4-dicarboxylate ABC transporter permease [Deltaproteobacteria bacterium]|nr:C4-dicarboxylate ABC transporter permease [Deltaproteobacteria bacterium]
MNPFNIGILGCALMVVLLFLGMPITFAMMFVGFVGIWGLSGLEAALPVVASTIYETAAYYPFTIIPLFVLMGGLADNSGITTRLYDTFDKWFRRLPGGLGIATIVAIAGFSAISGSSVATSAAFAKTVIPEMRRFKYNPKFAGGIVAAGATIDFLIPPSIGFVVYGMLTEQSIGKLLIAGMLPGLLLSVLFIGIIVSWVKIDPSVAPTSPGRTTWKEKIFALWGMWETILVFLITIGGMYLGYINPTEAGGIGCIALFIITLLKRELSWKQFVNSLYETTRVTCMVMFLVAGANLFSYFLALSTIPAAVSTWIGSLGVSRYIVLTIVAVIYLILGCFLDAVSMMVLTMPVIFPVMVGLGFDPIWFGVICVLMMNAGLITPPVGLNVYTIAGIIRDVPMKEVFKGAAPFLFAILATTVILTFFPIIATILPAQMGR